MDICGSQEEQHPPELSIVVRPTGARNILTLTLPRKPPNPDITEWYSSQEMQEKFGMTLSAIYCFVSKNAIPKKKEGIMVYYSKKHVDIAKGIAIPEEPQYYTVAEAMEKFNLTRDQLYHYAKYHNIPKVKKGKYTFISKPELDKLLAAPKIE